jgi:hypothetical protein
LGRFLDENLLVVNTVLNTISPFLAERKKFAKCKLSAEKTGVAENNKTKPCKRSAAPASFGIFGESQFFSGGNYSFCKIL